MNVREWDLDKDPGAPRFGDDGRASTFLQYKGTDICIDVVCLCGADGHFDGYFCHNVRCTACGRVYALPTNLNLRLLTSEEVGQVPNLIADLVQGDEQ